MWTRWIWPRAASPWIGSPITDRGRAGAMRFDVITLFPELIEPYLSVGVVRRAFTGAVQVRLWGQKNRLKKSQASPVR